MAYKDYEKQKKYQRIWRRNRNEITRAKAFDILGGKCVECGIEDWRVLQIDHKERILRKTRIDKSEDTGANLRRKIVSGYVDKDKLQLLCANCHQIKTHKEAFRGRIS